MGAFSNRINFRDEAFVLRTYRLGEADLIVVLLTRTNGIVRAVAKGARRTRSRFGARLDRFTRINVQIYPGRSLSRVTDAASIVNYAGPIVADPDRFFAGAALLELAQFFAQSEANTGDIFSLLDANLAALSHHNPLGAQLPPLVIADHFAVRCLEETGWAPSLVDCAQCGARGPHRAFHAPAGGTVCGRCRPPGAMNPPPESVRLLWLLQQRRYETAAEAVSVEAARTDGVALTRIAHELMVAYVRCQLDTACPAFAAL